MKPCPILAALTLGCATLLAADGLTTNTATRSRRILAQDGAPTDEGFFPVGVWLQDPRNAKRYQAAGINLFVGLWRGPTLAQLTELERTGLAVICAPSKAGLENKDNPIIAGWMHGDEPDNAQSLGRDQAYGPPIPPEIIIKDYQRIHAADPSRPVLLNLGQGVAWDNYIGRGVRRNHPEDYPEYAKGCDIASFDIYPVVHDSPEVAGKLEFVARGVERLVNWTRGEKPVWTCIECTHISNPQRRATPEQVRAEVWMALISGARGLIYFVHQFKPAFKEAALLDDPEMLKAITAINRQIRELAPVLNSPAVINGLTIHTSSLGSPIAAILKRHRDASYIFAVNLQNQPVRATIAIREAGAAIEANVLDEARHVAVQAGAFTEEFQPYAVRLYRIQAVK